MSSFIVYLWIAGFVIFAVLTVMKKPKLAIIYFGAYSILVGLAFLVVKEERPILFNFILHLSLVFYLAIFQSAFVLIQSLINGKLLNPAEQIKATFFGAILLAPIIYLLIETSWLKEITLISMIIPAVAYGIIFLFFYNSIVGIYRGKESQYLDEIFDEERKGVKASLRFSSQSESYQQVLKLLNQSLKEKGVNETDAAYSRFDVAFSFEKYEEALEQLEKFVLLNTLSGEEDYNLEIQKNIKRRSSYALMAICHEKLGNVSHALNNYKMAFETQGHPLEALYNGQAYKLKIDHLENQLAIANKNQA